MFIDVVRVVLTGLVCAYLAVVAFAMVFQVALHHNPQLAPSKMSAIDVASRGLMQSGHKRQFAIAALVLPSEAAAWPVMAMRRAQARAFESRLSNFHFSSALALRPLVLIQSAWGLCLAATCALLTIYSAYVWRPVLIALTVFLLVILIAKHLYFAVSGLQVSLRRSLHNPFAVFAAVALLDALALTLLVACASSRFGVTRAELSKEGLVEVAGSIFNVPSNVIEFTSLGTAGLAVATVGIIYSTALARSLVQPSQFQRTDDDRLALVNLLINVGDVDRAEQHLTRVTNVSVASLRAKARIQAARGKFEAAVQCAKKAAGMAGDDESDEAAVIALTRWWIYTTVELQVVNRFVGFILGRGMPDYVITEAVQNLAILAGTDPANAVDIVEQQLDGLPPGYPMTRAALLLINADFGEALNELESAAPADHLSQLWRPFLLLRTMIQDPGRSWDETVTDVSRLIEAHPIETLEPLVQGLTPTEEQFAGIQVFVAEAWLHFLEVRAAQEGITNVEDLRMYRAGLMVIADELIDSPSARQQLARVARDLLAVSTGERLP